MIQIVALGQNTILNKLLIAYDNVIDLTASGVFWTSQQFFAHLEASIFPLKLFIVQVFTGGLPILSGFLSCQ